MPEHHDLEEVPDPAIGVRIITVILRPGEVEGTWEEPEVDFPSWATPYEAYALLKAGLSKMEDRIGFTVNDTDEE